MSSIHPTAIIEPGATLGADVHIGPYSIVYAGASLGDRSVVGAHCEIGLPAGGLPGADPGVLRIGAGAVIRSGTVIYTNSVLGERFECGHKATIRENTVAGINLRVGTLTDIQGDCSFGDYVRLHGNVQVGKGSRVSDFVWIFPYVVLTNDPHPPSDHCIGVQLEEYAVVGAHSVLLPGVRIGREAVIGAASVVGADVPAGMLASGQPARAVCKASIVRDKLNPGQRAYPWQNHFSRGMPWQNVGYSAWLEQNPDPRQNNSQ